MFEGSWLDFEVILQPNSTCLLSSGFSVSLMSNIIGHRNFSLCKYLFFTLITENMSQRNFELLDRIHLLCQILLYVLKHIMLLWLQNICASTNSWFFFLSAFSLDFQELYDIGCRLRWNQTYKESGLGSWIKRPIIRNVEGGIENVDLNLFNEKLFYVVSIWFLVPKCWFYGPLFIFGKILIDRE